MFPLGTVLVPYGLLPLHVFEQRYRRLVADVLAADRRFGVVLIERGSEVGGGDQRFAMGTMAEVIDADQTADGRWAIVAAGTIRFRVSSWITEDPYPTAEVDPLGEEGAPPDRPMLDAAELQVRRALTLQAELGFAGPAPEWRRTEDPTAATWQLAALAPLEAIDRYKILAAEDAGSRVALIEELARERADLLALGKGGG